MAKPARIDYRDAMRASIDSRHQVGEKGVKAPGAAGSAEHRSGAGVEHPQNRLAPSEAGTGSRSGAKGGPSEHPQNKLSPSEAGESAAFESMEQNPGGESRESVPIGPRAVGSADEAIPHAGTGGQGRGGQGGGHQSEHPLNRVSTAAAGKGADGKGHAGGGAQKRGGHAQGKVLPVTRRRAGGGTRSSAPAKKAGFFLKALAGN